MKTQTATSPRAARRAVRARHPPRAQSAPQQAPKTQSRAVAVHQPPRPETFIQTLARLSSDSKVPAEKMRAILDMQKEVMQEEARRAFTRDYIAMQADLPVINATGRIVVDKKRDGTKLAKPQVTPFATFNEINKVTKPILRAHGFALMFAPDEGMNGRIVIRGYLEHVGGYTRVCTIPVPLEASGSKNDAQGTGSSISYGKRYATIALLNLISEAKEDHDDDGASAGIGPVVDEEQRTTIMERAATVGCSPANLIKGLNEVQPKGKRYPFIDRLDDLPAARYQEALDRLDRFAAAVAARESGAEPAAR